MSIRGPARSLMHCVQSFLINVFFIITYLLTVSVFVLACDLSFLP